MSLQTHQLLSAQEMFEQSPFQCKQLDSLAKNHLYLIAKLVLTIFTAERASSVVAVEIGRIKIK